MIYLCGNTTQTFKLSQQANTLNYGLSHFDQSDKILGLKAVTGTYQQYMSLVQLDGHCFTICAVGKSQRVHRWESPTAVQAEKDLIAQGYEWLVTMPGGDDHCGYTRFKTLEDAKKWFVSDEFIDYSNPEYWMVN